MNCEFRFDLLAINVVSFFNNLEEVKVKILSVARKGDRWVAIVESTNKQQRCTSYLCTVSLATSVVRG